MILEEKDIVVALKAYSPSNPLPLDARELYDSLELAEKYAATAGNAYAGQTIKVLQDGKYETYVINGEKGQYTLDKVGVDASMVKNYVQVVDTFPTENQEQGVIYVCTSDSKGYIWTGSQKKLIFEDVTALNETVKGHTAKFAEYAPLAGATFTGPVLLHNLTPVEENEAVSKQYVDGLMNGINSFVVDVVDGSHALPATEYKVGQTFRVAEAGTYAGQQCEAGDLILVIKDYAAEGASNADFLVIQANVDGTVTGAETVGNDHLAVFDGTNGRKIKDSNIALTALSNAIDKAHEHANKSVLDSFEKTQTELLEAVDTKISAVTDPIQATLSNKADKTALTEGLAKKVDQTTLTQTLTEYAKTEALSGYVTNETYNQNKVATDKAIESKLDETAVNDAIDAKTGITDKTVRAYVDEVVAAGGTDQAGAIKKAKDEAIADAKKYTDDQLTIQEF